MHRDSPRTFELLLESGLIVTVVTSVAAFGGTERISWSAVQAVLFLLGVVMAMGRPLRLQRGTLLGWLGPAALFLLVGIQFLRARFGAAAMDSQALREATIRLASYFCAFYVARAVARAPQARRRLVLALVLLSGFEALYGLIQYLTGWQQIFTYVKKYYVEDATGTYINHNHFAGLLAMVTPLSVGLAIDQAERSLDPRRHRPPGEWPGHGEVQKSLLLLFGALLCVLAIVFSRSRMGLISCVVSLLVMAALVAFRRTGRALSAALLIALLAAGAGFTFWIGVEPIVLRFASLPTQEFPGWQGGGRLAVWKDAAQLIRRHAWFGVGLGCFETAYTQVQTVHLDAVVDHAHNDYLELTAELGLAGAGLLFGLILTITAKALRAFYAHPDSAGRAAALGIFGGIIALLLHSLADFNLYIPANGLVFAVLLGLGSSAAADVPASAGIHRPDD